MTRRGTTDDITQNSVTLGPDGIVRLVQVGPQDAASVGAQRKQVEALFRELRAAGKPVLLLADLSQVHKTDSGARLEAKQFLDADYDAVAVIGNPYLQPIIAFVLRTVRKQDKVHYFGAEREALAWLTAPRHKGKSTNVRTADPLRPSRAIRWLLPVVFVIASALTLVMWFQARERVDSDAVTAFTAEADRLTNSLNEHLLVYIESLYGYRGLFHSSETVSEKEFTDYALALDTAESHPGIDGVSFVTTVPLADRDAFLKVVESDTSLQPTGNPSFAIIPPGDREEYFVLTYIVGNNAGKGVDLRVNEARRETLTSARDSGEPTATETVQLLDTQGQPQDRFGFLITIPIYKDSVPSTVEARRAGNNGFVNAVFDYQKLLGETFAEHGVADGVRVEVFDASGNRVYQEGPSEELGRSQEVPIAVAGQTWTLKVSAPEYFGMTAFESRLPLRMFFAGVILLLALAFFAGMQRRYRKQAVGLAEAMTEDLQLERNMAVATKNKDEAILSSIGDAVFAIDRNGRIILFNAAAEHISGYSVHEVLGKPYDEVLHFILETTGKPNMDFVKRAAAGHITSMKNHTVLVRKNGDYVPVADSAAPIRDVKGTINGVIVVFRDVSKEYALDKAKNEFVSLASHQLRTPLTAIGWNAELLLSGDAGKLSKPVVGHVKEIQEGTKRMVELVSSLLDVSRLDLGKLSNEAVPTSMAGLIQSLRHELTSDIEAKSLKVIAAIDKKVPDVVADPKLLRMIVQNLMSNAVKYTPAKGTLTITLRTATPEDHRLSKVGTRPAVFFSVADTGYGIPKVQQDRVFSKLFRADNARTLSVEGTGLGLYIVKQVITKLGGNVWFESTESVGTTFFVVLPVHTHTWKQKKQEE